MKDAENEDTSPSSRNEQETEEEVEDWFSRWEQRKKQQYEEFMRKIEQDPFTALFGKSNRWLGWTGETIARGATAPDVPESDLKSKAEQYIKQKESAADEVGEQTKKHPSQQPSGQAQPGQMTVPRDVEEEYDIDPITLRKVPKNTYLSTPTVKDEFRDVPKTFNIPVKTFKSSSKTPTKPAKNHSAKTAEEWLAREGFKFAQDSQNPISQSEYDTAVTPKAPASKIESALDRHLQAKNAGAKKAESLQYEPKENQEEDVDLLRASDIRASAGLRGHSAKESDAARVSRREALEERYDRQERYFQEEVRREHRYLKERKRQRQHAIGDVAPATRVLKNSIDDADYDPTKASPGITFHVPTIKTVSEALIATADKSEKLSSFANEKALRMQAKIVPLKEQIDLMKAQYDALRKRWLEETRRLKTKIVAKLHAEEVSAQKSAMEAMECRSSKGKAIDIPKAIEASELHRGEGDMAANVADFCSRDRWYKRKAPHAQDRMDAKMQQLTKDKAFVREIRGIYEDTYGTIDTKHRQTQAGAPKSEKSGGGYAMLKDDPSAQLLKDASASSAESAQKSTTHEHFPTIHQIHQIHQNLDHIHELTNRLRDSTISTTAQRTQRQTDSNVRETNTMTWGVDAISEAHQARMALTYAAEYAATRALRNLAAGPANRNPHFMSNLKAQYGLGHRDCICKDCSQHEIDQETAANEAAKGFAANTTTYRIIAYDFDKRRVDSVKSSSEKPYNGETPLTTLEALKLLHNPGKFLPHLMRFHNMGYDIVSGAPNIVVMKKVRDVDETQYVHREEPVFSGSKAGKGGHKRAGKRAGTLKAVLLTGIVTGGMCYAVGVASEMMKTRGL